MAAVQPASSAAVGSLCYVARSSRTVSQARIRMGVGSAASGGALSSETTTKTILTKLKKDCATPLPLLRHVADAMGDDMRAGLAFDGGSDLKMILTFVHALPTGNEQGLFYALDLGGTNFRVLRVQLGGKDQRVIATESEQVTIPQELMFGTSEELFDFIASGLANFVEKERGEFNLSRGRNRELGFTFSFPVKQTSIDSGILINWTKGFAVSGTVSASLELGSLILLNILQELTSEPLALAQVLRGLYSAYLMIHSHSNYLQAGRDVVACLNEAMERRGLDMQVSALVNDTVGTLAGARYWDDDVMVAVILGTGTNACYVEQTDAILKQYAQNSKSKTTIVNTEWGAFSTGLPLTEFDNDMDAESINPGEQIFEKTISGMYLGEIVRRVLVKLAEEGSLFGSNNVPDKLQTPFSLRTPHISAMQQDKSNDLKEVGSILYNETGVESTTVANRVVLEVCDTIAKRGGRLAGAGIIGILQKMEEDTKGLIFGKRTVVAMDGGLYENYPQYRNYLQDAVTELIGPELSEKLVIEHSKDGSGIGAALLAAANSKY